ncbi:MAG: glycosyltransferase [Rhodoglobus sp.]
MGAGNLMQSYHNTVGVQVKKRRSGVVSVVLVNYRGIDDTLLSIAELLKLDWPRELLEIVVVENNSGDDSASRLRALSDEIVLVESPTNLGFAGGCNLGVASTSGEFVAFLNNDARPDSQWVRSAMATFATSKTIGAVASKVLDWDGLRADFVDASLTWYGMGYKAHTGEIDRGEWDNERDVLFGTGAAMFVRASIFEELGGFDEKYFMFYEDVDLGWRLNLLGYRFRFQPASLAFHKHHASMDKFDDYHELYLLERNALYTLYKNLDDTSLADQFAPALLLAARRAVARGGLDSTSLDLRATGHESGVNENIGRSSLAGLYAMDQLVENLPELSHDRAVVQATRRRTDRELRRLMGNTDEPAFPIDSYLSGYEKIVGNTRAIQPGSPQRILVLTGDPIGEKMAGPAIRAWNMANELSREHEVRLISTSGSISRDEDFTVLTVSPYNPRAMHQHEKWADVIIVQGYALTLFPVLENSTKILVVDLYDPMHLEQLEQGRNPSSELWDKQVSDANDTLNHQLALGDFFLCASERQKHFWLGQLASVGRVNPFTYSADSNMSALLAIAPFGIPVEPPETDRPVLRGVVDGIGPDDKVIIWAGGIYDWFDPATLIRAVGGLAETHPEVKLFFMGTKHPNPAVPEMAAVASSRKLAEELGLAGKSVFFHDTWVDYSDRQNYLLEADAGVSTHFDHIETTYSFRTRILDYLWAQLPIISTEGDSFADLVERKQLGAVVPEKNVQALQDAIVRVLFDEDNARGRTERLEEARSAFIWASALAPLVEFCRNPVHAADKQPLPAGETVRTPTRSIARTQPRAGLARDVQRAMYYLKRGGPGAVMERFTARRKRRRESR